MGQRVIVRRDVELYPHVARLPDEPVFVAAYTQALVKVTQRLVVTGDQPRRYFNRGIVHWNSKG